MRLRLTCPSDLAVALIAGVALATAACGGSSSRGARDGADAAESASAARSTTELGRGRLGNDVRPLRYALDLSVDPDRDALFGVARIELDLVKRTDEILLHGQGLDVREVSVRLPGNEPVEGRWTQVNDEGLARVTLPQPVGPGEGVLRVVWSAPYSEGLRGAYTVRAGGDGYVFTQFEPLAARTVFPSFDEPRFKTPYDVSLTVRPEHVAIANAPQVSETEAVNGRKRIRFARTRPLPTYLVAFAVGPFDVVESEIPPNDVRDRPVPFRGVAVKGAGEGLAYAIEQTPVLLGALEEYFGTGYPYEKLDVIAVPDFGPGAMENAGAITFRDSLLLFDEASATGSHRMRFAGTMAHELAHQWFGNQVTLAWWNDIWLNEGFASWVEGKATEAWSPRDEPLLHDRLWIMEAMRADTLSSARRVRQPIEETHDIYNAFDAITYGKGAAVLAMFERWLGETTFRDGVRRYLRENRRTGVATSEDFFAALSAESGKDVAAPMATFLEQVGVPELEVSLVCDDGPPRVNVRQNRHRPAGVTGEPVTWQIPVCLRHEGGRTCALVTEAEAQIPLEGVDRCPEWVHPDAEGAGYYVWTLPPEQLQALRRRAIDALTPAERLSVVASLVAGFRSARVPAGDALAIFPRFTTEESRPLAIAPMGTLRFVGEHVVREADQAAWRRYAADLYDRVYERLGLQPLSRRETAQTAALRADVVRFLADVAEQRPVRNEAVRAARALTGFRRDNQLHLDAVAPDLYETVLVVAAEEGNGAYFDHLDEMFAKAEDPTMRQVLLRALSSFRADDVAARSRRLVFDDRLRQNERFIPLAEQLSSPLTRDATWELIRTEWDAIASRVAPYMLAYVPRLLGGFCSEARAAEVEAFFAEKSPNLPGGPRALAQTLEQIRLCAAVKAAQADSVAAFLAEREAR